MAKDCRIKGECTHLVELALLLIFIRILCSSMVIRDLTLRSAISFGSFHLIRLLYDEYMFYLVEQKIANWSKETPIAAMSDNRMYPAMKLVTKDSDPPSKRLCTKKRRYSLTDEEDDASSGEVIECSKIKGRRFSGSFH